MTIAVTGATGHLGQLTLAALAARGATDVIGLARSPEKLTGAARRFDYSDPSSFDALAGVDTLILISSSEVGQRAPQHRNVIEAAKAHGVGHILYTSLLHADRSKMQLAEEHVATEAALAASGLSYTLLRNGWYGENYDSAIGYAAQSGTIAGASGAGRIAAAARADYAEALAAVALDPGLQGKTYELAGDAGFTLDELAAEIAAQAGRTVEVSHLSEAEYRALLETMGLPGPFAAIIADSDAQAANGALFDDSHDLSRLIGRPTTPLAEIVRAALG